MAAKDGKPLKIVSRTLTVNPMTSSSNQTPEDSLSMDSATVQSVVMHMNSEHTDACLTIVRAFSEFGDTATYAQLVDMDREGLIFRIQTHERHASASKQNVRINFPKSLRTESQIRGALVGLTRQARQKLAV